MRILSICCILLLINMCIIMQQHSAEAKPFIFKFFLPQAPSTRDASSSTSTSSSTSHSTTPTGIDISRLISTKLNLLSSFLQAGLSKSISGGFNVGFNKFFPNTRVTTTRRPNTSTTNTTPDVEFEPESSTTASVDKRTTATTTAKPITTTESSGFEKSTGSAILSETIEVNTTEKSEGDNNVSKVTTDKTASSVDIVTGKYDITYGSTERSDNNESEKTGSSTEKTSNNNNDNSGIEIDSKITADNISKPSSDVAIKSDFDNTSANTKVTTSVSVSNGYNYNTGSKATNNGNGYNYSTSKVITSDNKDSGYEYTTARVTTFKPNGYKYNTPQTGYNYEATGLDSMSENEISNEVMMINNQYLPAF